MATDICKSPLNSSGSWGESWLRTSETVMKIHSSLLVAGNIGSSATLTPLSKHKLPFFFKTGQTVYRSGCHYVAHSCLTGPSLLTWRLESKVSTYRRKGKPNSLPLCARREDCSAASWESPVCSVGGGESSQCMSFLTVLEKKNHNSAFPFHSFRENGEWVLLL